MLTEDGPFGFDVVTNTYVNRLRVRLDLGQASGLWTNGFGYDSAKRLTNVTSPAGSFGYTYLNDASSLLKLITLPSGAYITNTYDDMARLTGTYMKNSSHSVLDLAVYGYNAGSQRTAFTNAAGAHVGYAYDSIGQLKLADSSVNTEDKGYLYDAAWNLTTRTNNAGNDDFTVDSKNQLSSTPLGSPFYDGNGNLYLIIGGPEWHWGYDAENQMTAHYNGVEDKTYGFAYDGLGRLRQRWEVVWNEAEQAWLPAGIINYICDGRRVIQERTASPITPVTSYTRGIDLSGTLEGAGGIGGLLVRTGHSGTGGSTLSHAYYHADGNGNITYLIDNSQSMVASYRYDPFGNTLSQSGTLADANVYRFSSKEIHAPSGMYYFGFRWYEPNLQRWLNRDPLGDTATPLLRSQGGGSASFPLEAWQGCNLYTFVRNSPIVAYDPDGRQVIVPAVGVAVCVSLPLTILVNGAIVYAVVEICLPDNSSDKCENFNPANPDHQKKLGKCLDQLLEWMNYDNQTGIKLPKPKKKEFLKECMEELGVNYDAP